MIPLTETPVSDSAVAQGDTWHRSLAEAIRDPAQLVRELQLEPALIPQAIAAATAFPLMVPRSFLRRMQPANVDDPLLKQVLPLGAELESPTGFSQDPVDDHRFRIAPGLLRKYSSRALLIATGSCAVHCRYCFRRHYQYGDEPKRLSEWQEALNALAQSPEIDEVILSGGDPLMLADQRLADLIGELESIPRLQRLRIHSRLPIVLPDRVTDRFLDILARGTRLTPIMVVHANHPAEIVGDCANALQRLVSRGITTLNQAVLLRGVNDSVEAQAGLCRALVNLGVIPYYLHQLDRVAGAAHFEVPVAEGQRIIAELRKLLPGYAVPRFVQEMPGELHKTLIESL